jgi:hypothetical protein
MLFLINNKEFIMGLKLVTLSMYAFTGKQVKLHTTGEKAKVTVTYPKRGMVFCLEFDDGRKQEVHWNLNLQGFVGTDGEDLDEITDEVMA